MNPRLCRIALVCANVLVAGFIGYMTGAWALKIMEPASAQAIAGFAGWMSVLTLEYGALLTKTVSFAKMLGR